MTDTDRPARLTDDEAATAITEAADWADLGVALNVPNETWAKAVANWLPGHGYVLVRADALGRQMTEPARLTSDEATQIIADMRAIGFGLRAEDMRIWLSSRGIGLVWLDRLTTPSGDTAALQERLPFTMEEFDSAAAEAADWREEAKRLEAERDDAIRHDVRKVCPNLPQILGAQDEANRLRAELRAARADHARTVGAIREAYAVYERLVLATPLELGRAIRAALDGSAEPKPVQSYGQPDQSDGSAEPGRDPIREAQAEARGDDPMSTAITITVTDPDNGEVLETRTIDNDFIVLCAGDRYVSGVQAYGNGTQVVTVKRTAEVHHD